MICEDNIHKKIGCGLGLVSLAENVLGVYLMHWVLQLSWCLLDAFWSGCWVLPRVCSIFLFCIFVLLSLMNLAGRASWKLNLGKIKTIDFKISQIIFKYGVCGSMHLNNTCMSIHHIPKLCGVSQMT